MPIWTNTQLAAVEGTLLDHCIAVRHHPDAPLHMTTRDVDLAIQWGDEREVQIALTRLSKHDDDLVEQLAEKSWRIGG